MSADKNGEAAAPCIECGAAPGGSILVLPDDGGLPETPKQWIYCYDNFQPKGLCDLCYRSGRTSMFTAFQLEYLKQMFEEDYCDPSLFGQKSS